MGDRQAKGTDSRARQAPGRKEAPGRSGSPDLRKFPVITLFLTFPRIHGFHTLYCTICLFPLSSVCFSAVSYFYKVITYTLLNGPRIFHEGGEISVHLPLGSLAAEPCAPFPLFTLGGRVWAWLCFLYSTTTCPPPQRLTPASGHLFLCCLRHWDEQQIHPLTDTLGYMCTDFS